MQIKIDNEIFDCIDGIVQLSIGTHASITINLDLNKNPSYEQFFIKLYESNRYFRIISKNFETNGTNIKTLDFDFNNKRLNVSFHCDVLNTTDKSLRRDDTINEILDKTFNNNEDII
jgi:hypothetical protein